MIALSVMWMRSGQTSVQHFVMLHIPRPPLRLEELAPIVGVEWMHLEFGVADEQPRPREPAPVLIVVAQDVTYVLA